jgi:hypothetical protein
MHLQLNLTTQFISLGLQHSLVGFHQWMKSIVAKDYPVSRMKIYLDDNHFQTRL